MPIGTFPLPIKHRKPRAKIKTLPERRVRRSGSESAAHRVAGSANRVGDPRDLLHVTRHAVAAGVDDAPVEQGAGILIRPALSKITEIGVEAQLVIRVVLHNDFDVLARAQIDILP